MAELQNLLTSMQTASEKVARLEQQGPDRSENRGEGALLGVPKAPKRIGSQIWFRGAQNGGAENAQAARSRRQHCRRRLMPEPTNDYQAGKGQAESEEGGNGARIRDSPEVPV